MNTKPLSFKELEAQAIQTARQNFGAVVPAVYVEGACRKVTKEMAVAQALEANPEAYAEYRRQHNVGAIVRQLEAAGYQLRRA